MEKERPFDEKLDLIFLIDRSGSMYNSVEDTIGGFNSFIEKERAKNTKGTRKTRKIKRKEENRFSLQNNYKMKVLELITLKM